MEDCLRRIGCTAKELDLARQAREAMDVYVRVCALEAAGVGYVDAVGQILGAPSIAPNQVSEPPKPKRSRRRRNGTIPRKEQLRALCLQIQGSDLRIVARLRQQRRRERGEPFIGVSEMMLGWSLAHDALYETDGLGRLIGFTVEEDEYIGHHALGRPTRTYKRKDRFITMPPEQFLRRVSPGAETPDETSTRRAASKRAERIRRDIENRSARRARAKAMREHVGALDCRPSAILAAMIPRRWMTVRQIAATLKGSTAFGALNETSLHRTIARELAKQPLSNMADVLRQKTARRGFSTNTYRLRRQT